MKLVANLAKHILPGVIKPVHALWNEVIGFIFLVLAALIGVSTWRRAQHFNADTGGLLVIVGSCLFALLLAWFGISSFWKARKISRS